VKPRIYIAGPMTGLPLHNLPAFDEAARAWRAAGWHVVSPAESFNRDCTLPYRYYVEHDVYLIKSCDALAMLPGWDSKTARGSVWEYFIAKALLGLPVFDASRAMPPEALARVQQSGLTPVVGAEADLSF
jgi:nucleoside 2-deoxyribosyltransferase